MDNLELPRSEEGHVYSADLPAQPASELVSNEITDAVFDSFLARFGDWQTDATPGYGAPSLPTSMAQYVVDNTTVVSLPQYVDGYTHIVDGMHVSNQLQYGYDNAAATVSPSYSDDNHYTADGYHSAADSVPRMYNNYTGAPYALHGYTTGGISFDVHDMGVYPQVIDQTYMFTAPMGASNFPIQGLYVH